MHGMTISKITLTSIFVLLATRSVTLANPDGTENWRMEQLSDEWHFAGFENSFDISGVASASPTQCLVGSDESFYVQPGVIDPKKKRIESRRPIPLPLEESDGKMEIDIEGVTYSVADAAYFVVGSHGVGKKKADFQIDRHAVCRIPVDQGSGKVLGKEVRRTSLLPWLAKTPLLAPYVKTPLQQNGLNIEGLTSSEGKLYFGLRSPNKDGVGFVIEISEKELFEGPSGELRVHEIPIRKGRGIREIAAVEGGFLLLTGNASAEATKKIPVSYAPGPDINFELLFWRGEASTPELIGELPQNGGKAEALLVLEDHQKHIDVLVVFDSLPGGLPISFRVFR